MWNVALWRFSSSWWPEWFENEVEAKSPAGAVYRVMMQYRAGSVYKAAVHGSGVNERWIGVRLQGKRFSFVQHYSSILIPAFDPFSAFSSASWVVCFVEMLLCEASRDLVGAL